MKLGIVDYQLSRGGGERFVLGVLSALPEEVDVTIFTGEGALEAYQVLVAQLPRPVTLVHRPIMTHRSALVEGDQAALSGETIYDIPAEFWDGHDLLWFPWVNRHLIPRQCMLRTVATVHDMISVEWGEFIAEKRAPLGRVGYYFGMGMEDMLMRRLAGSLAKLVVDAKRTADHVSRTYGPLSRTPEVIYLSAEHMAETVPEPIEALDMPPRYLIYPANYTPHKNHEALLLALAKVKAERPDMFVPLVLTGWRIDCIPTAATDRGAYLKALIDHLKLEIGKDIHIPGRVTDGQFRSLLQGATGLVFPSFPPVEAALLGIPVAVSDIEIMRESLSRFDLPAVWFRPDSVDEIAAAMIRLAAEETELRAKAVDRIDDLKGDSWAEVGQKYLAVFREQISVASMYQQYAGAE
jgi:glycosyltransferase involved in cell wall biosynthesis